MASKTPKLGLIKPNRGEYFNTWDSPANKNLDVIDEVLGDTSDELISARGNQASLSDRLDNAMDSNGFIKSPEEMTAARSSTVYGSDDGSSDYTLDARIEQADREIWTARQQNAKLIDALAWTETGNTPNAVISAANNYITFTGAVVTVNGAVTPVVANINGYRQVVRTNKTTTISGAAGTYYLYLQRDPNGEITYTVPAGTGSVATYTPTSKLSKFSSSTGNFVTAGVKPGDILRITGPLSNPNVGEYIVHSTNVEDSVNLAPNEVRIIGEFVTASTGVDAEITNPIAPTLNFQSAAHAKQFAQVTGKIFIGRCVFDGSSVTSLTIYALKGIYDAFTSVSADFSTTIAHNLGYVPSKILFFASQASDFTQPLEPLSVAEVSTGAASLSFAGSVGTTPAVVNFNPGTTTLTPNTPQVLSYTAPTLNFTDMIVTYTPPTLSYTAPILRRSVVVRFTDTTIEVKNASTGLFYRDFSGVDQVSGYLRIVCER